MQQQQQQQQPGVGVGPSPLATKEELLRYMRMLAREGVRLPADSPNAITVRESMELLFADASMRQLEEASEAYAELVLPAAEDAAAAIQQGLEPGVGGMHGLPAAVVAQAVARLERQQQLTLDPEQQEREMLELCAQGGWFGELIRFTAQFKASPQMYLGAALAFAGAAFARKPQIMWNVKPCYTNLFVLLVCDTGTSKSTSVSWARRIMQPGLGVNLLANEGSPQGYAAQLKARWEFTGECADGLIVADEYKVLIGADKYKQQLVTWLTDWYGKDGPWFRALSAEDSADKFYFENPRLGICAASTMEWLRLVQEDAILGGFMPRHLIFDTPRMRWCEDVNPDVDEADWLPLTEALRGLTLSVPDKIDLTADAWQYLRDWHNGAFKAEWYAEQDRAMLGWYQRKQEAVIKVATICHLVNRHHEQAAAYWVPGSGMPFIPAPVCICCVHWARRLVDWLDCGVRRIYGELGVTDAGRGTYEVLQAIRESNDPQRALGGANGGKPQGVTTKQLKRMFRYKFRRVRELMEVLAELQADKAAYADLQFGRAPVWRAGERPRGKQ